MKLLRQAIADIEEHDVDTTLRYTVMKCAYRLI